MGIESNLDINMKEIAWFDDLFRALETTNNTETIHTIYKNNGVEMIREFGYRGKAELKKKQNMFFQYVTKNYSYDYLEEIKTVI